MTLVAEAPSMSVGSAAPPVPPGTVVVDLPGHEEFARRKRWTREECDVLERVGLLTGRYELLDGEIVDKMGQNPPHAYVMMLLTGWLISVFGVTYVSSQSDMEILDEDQSTSLPVPDFTVRARPAIDFVATTPGPGDILLVVEVSDTSLSQDLRVKSRLYARAGIPEYWIADVPGRRFIVQTDPDRVAGKYNSVATYDEFQPVAPLAAPDHPLQLTTVLPPLPAS